MRRSLLAVGFVALLGIATTAAAQSPTPSPGPPGSTAVGPNFVDANGDGICDRFQAGGQAGKAGAPRGARRGPGDSTGNQGIGPRDGTGYGAGRTAGGCGQCPRTGNGPNGARRGSRR